MRRYLVVIALTFPLVGCNSNRFNQLTGLPNNNSEPSPHYDKVVLYDCCVGQDDPGVILLCADLKSTPSHEIREDANTVLRASCVSK